MNKKKYISIAKEVINLEIKALQNLKKKIKVKLSLFGAFNIRKKNSRIGRNPKTKETKIINSRYVVTFKSSKLLLKKINKVS